MSSNPFLPPEECNQRDPVLGVRPSGDLAWILLQFDGRLPRRTYWAGTIGSVVVFYALVFLIALVLGEQLGSIAMIMLYVPLIWVSLALQIKRWHDRGKSGWWCLVNFIPLLGGLWSFLELGWMRGTHGPNLYGPDPW